MGKILHATVEDAFEIERSECACLSVNVHAGCRLGKR